MQNITTTRFKDQVALVTGAARGIGAAIAQRLAREGAHLILMDTNRSGLEGQLKTIKGATAFQQDITSEPGVDEMLSEIYQQYGRLDILVNCAGIVGPTGMNISEYALSDFRQVLEVNLTGSFILTQQAIKYMLKNDYGRILHISSIGGKEGNPGMVGYAASKSGLMGLVKAVGKEFAESGITVNGLAPAVIATDMNLETDQQVLQYMIDKIPMKRLGTVEEVASLACWIVSPEASFNTGYVFDISGGRATY